MYHKRTQGGRGSAYNAGLKEPIADGSVLAGLNAAMNSVEHADTVRETRSRSDGARKADRNTEDMPAASQSGSTTRDDQRSSGKRRSGIGSAFQHGQGGFQTLLRNMQAPVKKPRNANLVQPLSPRSPNLQEAHHSIEANANEGPARPTDHNNIRANGDAAPAQASTMLSGQEKVLLEKLKLKCKEQKTYIKSLEKSVKEQSRVILSLEKSLAIIREKAEVPEFLLPKSLKKVTKRVIAAFLRGDQFWSSLYPDVETVQKVFQAELKLAHRNDIKQFQLHWLNGFGQEVMRKLGDRRSKLGGRFRQSLAETTSVDVSGMFPDSEGTKECKKAKKLEFQNDISWMTGPNYNDEGVLLEGEDETPELLKGHLYRISFYFAMGGLYKDQMRARADVFAYFARVGELFWMGQQMSSTNVERDRTAVAEYADMVVSHNNLSQLKYARLVEKRSPPEDLACAPIADWRVLKAGETLNLDGECEVGGAAGSSSSSSDDGA